VPQWILGASGKGLAKEATPERAAEECPKCLRRWSTVVGNSSFGCIDGPSPDDEIDLGDFRTSDDREFAGADAGKSTSDAGMSTVEYAVGTVVAAAFAAVLYRIVTGDSVIAGLTNLINTALSTTF